MIRGYQAVPPLHVHSYCKKIQHYSVTYQYPHCLVKYQIFIMACCIDLV